MSTPTPTPPRPTASAIATIRSVHAARLVDAARLERSTAENLADHGLSHRASRFGRVVTRGGRPVGPAMYAHEANVLVRALDMGVPMAVAVRMAVSS